jgi:hypothetical protein
VKLYRALFQTKKLSAEKLEEIYYQGVARWGHIVIQTGLRSGIPLDESREYAPPAGHKVLRDLRAPLGEIAYSVPVNQWENPIWLMIRKLIVEQVKEMMKMELRPREMVFCQQIQGQMMKAARMNRVQLIDLIEAWRYIFSQLHHAIHEDLRDRFEEWRQKCHSTLYQSRWSIFDLASWEIRLSNGRRIRVFDAENQDQEVWDERAIRLRDSIIEIWRLIREAHLIDFDEEGCTGTKAAHHDRIYEELQLEVELLSLSTGRDVPNEILRWISFKHRGPPPRRKSLPQLPFTEKHEESQETTEPLDVESTHRGPETTNSGPRIGNFPPAAQWLSSSRSCESFGIYRTVEERIQLRKQRGQYLFRRK